MFIPIYCVLKVILVIKRVVLKCFMILIVMIGVICVANVDHSNAEELHHPDSLVGSPVKTSDCMWRVTEDNVLFIWPANGSSGILPNNVDSLSAYWPWYGHRTTVVKAVVEPGVFGPSGSLGSMFYGFSALVDVDLSGLDTRNVTDMRCLFGCCSSLTYLDLSCLNTMNVTNMGSMFSDCSRLVGLDLSNFNTSKVTRMGSMFRNCLGLEHLDLSNFDTSNVNIMVNMFRSCSGLRMLNIFSFDTGNVTDMSGIFYECRFLREVVLGPSFSFKSSVALPTPG